MFNFYVQGVGEKTGKRRRHHYYAKDESHAREMARDDGTVIEDIGLDPGPPTERQLKYATDLKIDIPDNISCEELNFVFDLYQDGDTLATDRHRSFAKLYGIDTYKYIGKEALFHLIMETLVVPGREYELLSWFTFRVYLHLVQGEQDVPIKDPRHWSIEETANILILDEKAVRLVKDYMNCTLIWFGQYTAPDGQVYSGDSKKTYLYRTVSKLLKEKIEFPSKKKSTKNKNTISLPDGEILEFPIKWRGKLLTESDFHILGSYNYYGLRISKILGGVVGALAGNMSSGLLWGVLGFFAGWFLGGYAGKTAGAFWYDVTH